MSGTASFIALTHHSSDLGGPSKLSWKCEPAPPYPTHLARLLLSDAQGHCSDIAINEGVEIDRLGEVARRHQQIAHPGELVHWYRHIRIDGRKSFHFIVSKSGQRIVRFGQRDLACQRECLVAVR